MENTCETCKFWRKPSGNDVSEPWKAIFGICSRTKFIYDISNDEYRDLTAVVKDAECYDATLLTRGTHYCSMFEAAIQEGRGMTDETKILRHIAVTLQIKREMAQAAMKNGLKAADILDGIKFSHDDFLVISEMALAWIRSRIEAIRDEDPRE